MIHLFNRRELLITHRMDELSRVRDVLSENGIPYRIKTRSSVSSPFGSRGRPAVPGIRTEALYQYQVFVKKEDFDKAQFLIRR
ncbi:MAG: hypothetical protein E7458_09845 [Ruminococcaceae bacterium]|nr:hypothetical protein [Oscillospiraceae bacterium]